MIHPTAIIHPKAQVDSTASIGPYSIIGEQVVIGPGCQIAPHVHIAGATVMGANNRVHTGAVIGDAPQDLKYRGEPTGLRIGDNNVFRENVTVHRANNCPNETTIGSNCLFMAGCHVAHDCHIGSHVILANGVLLGGHVLIADRALLSGNCLVHQFIRIGMMAMMQGGSAISRDLPPFGIARGDNGMCGLNIIGMRRAGFPPEQRLELKRLYHLLFRSGQKMASALALARTEFQSEYSRLVIEFVASAKRGICRDTGSLVGQAEEAEGE